MSVSPSYPILVVADDDRFRKELIRALDERHFSVTFTADPNDALRLLERKAFSVIVLSIDARGRKNLELLERLRERSVESDEAVLVLAPPSPELREMARFADETLMTPVDADYLARRAQTYCA